LRSALQEPSAADGTEHLKHQECIGAYGHEPVAFVSRSRRISVALLCRGRDIAVAVPWRLREGRLSEMSRVKASPFAKTGVAVSTYVERLKGPAGRAARDRPERGAVSSVLVDGRAPR